MPRFSALSSLLSFSSYESSIRGVGLMTPMYKSHSFLNRSIDGYNRRRCVAWKNKNKNVRIMCAMVSLDHVGA